MRVPVESLVFFDAAVRHASFASAATELNVTPSAVSQRIKSLEQSLGILLFERLPHGLRPTEAGQLYALEIRPALDRLGLATARAASRSMHRPPGRSHRLSLDMAPALARARMVPALGDFQKNFPDIELKLTSSRAVTDPMRDGFDCCIRYGRGGWRGVDSKCIAKELVFPVCAPLLMSKNTVVETAVDLSLLPLIHDLMPIGWTEWFASIGTEPPKSTGPVFSDSSLALQAAVDGLGVALGRSVLTVPDLASGRLIRLSKHNITSPFSYWLIRPLGQRDSLVELFVSWLLERVLSQ